NGRLSAYSTGAPACSPASWPKFHHDNANSGDLDRDATDPGRPTGAAVAGSKLTFTSPGDDLLCGTPAKYDVVTSKHPITAESFADGDPVATTGAPVAAGSKATLDLGSAALERYVAVRAVDDQGNLGLPAVVDSGPPGQPVDNSGDQPAVPTGSPPDSGSAPA